MLRTIFKKIIDTIIFLESLFLCKETHTQKRVLILRKDTLGDYILFYPTLLSYRKKYSDAEITLVISSLFRDLEPLLSSFENIIWFDAKKFSSSFLYRRKFLLGLSRKGFDIAIQPTFSREPMGDFMITITGAQERIGVDGDCTASTEDEKRRNNTIYTKLVTIPNSIITELDKNIAIAEKITGEHVHVVFPTIDYKLFQEETALQIQKEHKLENGKYVIFFPGSGTRFKVWPVEKFAEIADYFIEKKITPVICGSKGEIDLVESILMNMKYKEDAVNLSGKTDLPTMIRLLKNSKCYFGSDTGITHIAAGIQIPAICLLGGGHFKRFFPYGDLTRNRIVFDESMTCMNDNWDCAKGLKGDESAPCVKNIRVENVKKEIDILFSIL
jgi:ADP-heptose:LPS heptosyltransferase